MKRTILYFLLLLFSVWLGIIMHRNPGYVLLSFSGWSVETSLWFAVIILIMLFLLFYLLLRFGSGVESTAIRIKMWISSRRKRRARAQTISGLYDFVVGKWAHAENKLSRAAKYSDMPLINYLAAAFVAQRQGVIERRDQYLLSAQESDAKHPIVVGLTRARLQIFNQQWEEALATLQNLQQLQPKNVFTLQLLKQVYLQLKDWSGLKILLPLLRKYRVFGIEEINQLEIQVYRQWFLTASTTETIVTKWYELSRNLQKQPALVALYAEYLLANNKAREAEDILKIVLCKVLDDRLLELYATLPSADAIKKLARTERWLKTNPENAALLLCLGRMCKQQKLWGKACQYLEKSANLAPTATVYLELGQIMEIRNDLRGALNYYNKGLQAKSTVPSAIIQLK